MGEGKPTNDKLDVYSFTCVAPRGVAKASTTSPFGVPLVEGKINVKQEVERQGRQLLKSSPGTNRSVRHFRHSSRNPTPTPNNSPERKPAGLETGKDAGGSNHQNNCSTSDATHPTTSPQAPTNPPCNSTAVEAIHKAKAEAEKQENYLAQSGPGTNRSGCDPPHSSRNTTLNKSPENKSTDPETGENAGVSSRQNNVQPPTLLTQQLFSKCRNPLPPPLQQVEAKPEAPAQTERQKGDSLEFSSTKNVSGLDSQHSSRNPTPNNSPENKSTDAETGKNAGVSSHQNNVQPPKLPTQQLLPKRARPKRRNALLLPLPQVDAKLETPAQAERQKGDSLESRSTTNVSGRDSQYSSPYPTPNNRPEGESTDPESGENAGVSSHQNNVQPPTLPTQQLLPKRPLPKRRNALLLPVPQAWLCDSPREYSTELGTGRNPEFSSTCLR